MQRIRDVDNGWSQPSGIILESIKKNADSAGAFNSDLVLRDLEAYRRDNNVAVDEQVRAHC
jgi:hypothetical protein